VGPAAATGAVQTAFLSVRYGAILALLALGGRTIVASILMARPGLAAAFVVMGLTLSAVPALADTRSNSKAQVDFGIKAAQRELWKEALYRWKRAVELDPSYAAAHNNLAIAYEHNGQFDDARVAYEKALELEPNNVLIKQNYDLFREINDRANRNGER
jgi:Flp pilus assembly protein TadD